MQGQAEVCAWVALHDWRTDAVKHRRARLRALVADIRSNIISTTTLCAAGWKFVQDKESFQVVDAQSGEVAADVAYFAGCPWIKLQPDWGMQSWVGKSTGKCMSHVCAENGNFAVHRLTRASEEALQKHRMQGIQFLETWCFHGLWCFGAPLPKICLQNHTKKLPQQVLLS